MSIPCWGRAREFGRAQNSIAIHVQDFLHLRDLDRLNSFQSGFFDTNLALSLQPVKPLNDINKSTEKRLLNFCLLQTTKEEGKGFAQCIKALIAALFLLSTSCIISSQQWLRLAIFGWLDKSTFLKEAAVWGCKTLWVVEIECFHLKGNNTWPGHNTFVAELTWKKNIFGLLASKKQVWSSMDCQKVAKRKKKQWQPHPFTNNPLRAYISQLDSDSDFHNFPGTLLVCVYFLLGHEDLYSMPLIFAEVWGFRIRMRLKGFSNNTVDGSEFPNNHPKWIKPGRFQSMGY